LRSRILGAAVAALLTSAAFNGLAHAVAQPTQQASGIASVAATESAITVTGMIPAADDPVATSIDVYELDPTQDAAAYQDSAPVASAAPDGTGAFRASFDRYAGARDRYYSKFLAVARTADGAEPLGAPHYVDDVRFAATNDYPFPRVADKKGLQVEMTDDAEQLGVQHGAINVAFNQLMLLRNADPADTITFTVDGTPFYFDRSYVTGLDGQIKSLSDNGTLVDLILILYRDTNPNSAFPRLVHPDAELGGGTVYAFDTKTAQGLEYFKAAMEFLTERYTRADQRYGRALGYIVGNEVDTAYVWQNMGQQPLVMFLEYYERALRVAWQAARAAYSDPQVYISLDHEWTVPYDPSRPEESYAGKDVVDGLAALSRQTGDFPWAVAYHPYPQNLFDPAFWHDTQATADADTTPLITFKNIQVLPGYLKRPALTYDGQQRRIILSEQGCNTPNDSLEGQKLQAACYAYAYYKVRFLDGIDAFILHRHVDHQAEGGLRLGLWTWDDARAGYALPGAHKYIYDVFKYIDTARSLDVTRFALPIIGISDWSQVVPGFDPTQLDQRAVPQQVGMQLDGRPVSETPVSGFEDGTDGWQASDNASSVEQVSGAGYRGSGGLRVHFDSGLPSWSTDAKTWKGADLRFASPVDASATPHLDLALRVPQPDPGTFQPGTRSYAEVKVYSTDGRIAYGLVGIDASGPWQPVSLDLSSWTGVRAISRIKVWVRATSDDDWRGSFDIDQVGFATRVAPATDVRNLDVTAVASSRSGVGATVTLTVTDNDAQPLRGELETVPCDGITLTPADLPLGTIAPAGGVATVHATITGYQPADRAHPTVCFDYGGRQLAVPLDLPPPTETVLYGFEDGTDGWQPQQNVAAVQSVTAFPNGPGVPHGGSRALDATAAATAASAAKTVVLEPGAPLDLSAAESFTVWIDAYGGAPGATGYQAEVTLWSGTVSRSAALTTMKTDQWNKLSVDVGGWAQRNSITKIEVGFHALGTDATWAPHFQIDDVGYFD
jgi:hypothetical protein